MSDMKEAFPYRFWFNDVENIINQSIAECYPRFWKEDGITQNLLMSLSRKFPKAFFLIGPNRPENLTCIEWDVFKLDGRIEEERGDVAVLVRMYLGSGSPLEGVAYFEAKKMDAGQLSGIASWNQLEIMRLTVPHHNIVIYDNEPISLLPLFSSDKQRCAVIATNCILALRKKSRDVYAFSRSFPHQLCYRYLFGLDLEFDECSKARAKGFLGNHIAPKFLFIINVGRNGVEMPALTQPDISSGYHRLTEDDRIIRD